jgi:isopentenyl phosphate kinase
LVQEALSEEFKCKGEPRNRLIVLKLGGSAITRKGLFKTADLDAIDRLAKEIANARVAPLIVVHGGGSFGHPIAKKHKIKDGYKEESQLVGFSETHQAMLELNKLVLDALIHCNIAAVPVAPSSCIVSKAGRIQLFFDCSLRMMLDKGFVPLLFGDTILDEDIGFTIVSGDQLVAALAIAFNAGKVILGVDVDGLHTIDPKTTPSAELIAHINLQELKSIIGNIEESKVTDVTGGMLGKVSELMPVTEAGIPILLTNAGKEDNIRKALIGEKVVGTLIERA